MKRVTICKTSEFQKGVYFDMKTPAPVIELRDGVFTDFPTAKYHWRKVFERHGWAGEWFKEFGGFHWTTFDVGDKRVRVILKNEYVIEREWNL